MTSRLGVMLLAGAAFSCSKDNLKQPLAPPPPDTSVADRAALLRSLCEAYFTYATLETYTQFPYGPFCTEHPMLTSADLGAPVLDFVCRPGWPGYEWSSQLLAAADAGRVEIDAALVQQCVDAAFEVKLRVPAVDLPADP